jgi:S-adenosylmethionine decarboxylase
MDYRVRGFTREVRGRKHFIDHKINSIQNFLSKDTRQRYQMVDVNVYQENIFHTKMRLKEFELDNYLFGMGEEALSAAEKRKISKRVEHEMMEIFSGRNMARN